MFLDEMWEQNKDKYSKQDVIEWIGKKGKKKKKRNRAIKDDMDKCCKVSGDLQLQFFNIFKHYFPNITWEVYLLVLHITLISMSKYTLLEYPINQEKDFFFPF